GVDALGGLRAADPVRRGPIMSLKYVRFAMISGPFLASARIFWSRASAAERAAVCAGASLRAGVTTGGACAQVRAAPASKIGVASSRDVRGNLVAVVKCVAIPQRCMRTSGVGGLR